MSVHEIESVSEKIVPPENEEEGALTLVNKKITNMMRLQNEMNLKVHTEWIAQGFEWYRAAWIECGELMDHLGYKWWKKQTPDEAQVKLEIVDIWHFAMSSYFDEAAGTESGFDELCKRVGASVYDAINLCSRRFGHEYTQCEWGAQQQKSIRLATEAVAEASLAGKQVPVAQFWELLVSSGMDLDQLYAAYIGKNMLNRFRQDKGYKSGEYQKNWHGREDNEHLAEVVSSLDPDAEDFQGAVYAGLEAIYASLD